jgi:hypothetical protein
LQGTELVELLFDVEQLVIGAQPVQLTQCRGSKRPPSGEVVTSALRVMSRTQCCPPSLASARSFASVRPATRTRAPSLAKRRAILSHAAFPAAPKTTATLPLMRPSGSYCKW